ncbi:metal ABC transporter substrate-binding protein [Microbacterium oryzae]|uniref:Metal ABC transporter substrate-binding protein n=1 Tax=Microbacterium oryzae TaxID=743009 RepID=A0A6I6E0K7_9MICO|nr:metal ABC transporter substrate-binding protein [Microbacterium oryzae]QGU27459.1 metal ABC transporter substrate-binding protein [Microbacterium oryzae]
MPKNRRVAGAALLAVAALLSACAAQPAAEGDGRPVVLTTFTVLADIAQNVAGEHLAVQSITKVGAEIHGYEPTPGDMRRAADAALVLDNGMGLEAWFAQFVDAVDAPHVVVSDGVEPISIEGTDHPNPHAWMSPANARIYVDNIVAAFSDLDPAHADAYAANGAAYRGELQAVADELVAALAPLPENERALVTCEGAFSYLARDADLAEAYIWPVNAEQQARPQQIAAVTEFVDDRDVPAVFCESTVSDKPMQRVVEATGAAFGGTLYVDSLSEADGPVPTYLDLIRHDVDLIVEGLTG